VVGGRWSEGREERAEGRRERGEGRGERSGMGRERLGFSLPDSRLDAGRGK
jgi:hypothetical protein